jgi:hypothetical protein
MLTSGFLAPLCAAALLSAAAAQETPKQLTARELFYSASQAPKAEVPKPAVPPAVAPKTPETTATRIATRVPSGKTPPAPARQKAAAPVRPVESAQLPDGGKIITASVERPATAPLPAAGPALGLRYTLLKKVGDDMVEVPTSTVFHAGDRIQFYVQTNGPGYLYIISQGSSGTWKPMFPSPEVEEGNNHVDGWRSYSMPPKSRIVFDEQTGTEKIFIVFSRAPEQDLENLIYSLRNNKAEPASAPQPPARSKQMTQVASVDDATVGRLRSVYSRDLIVEAVTPNTPGEKKETAVYVVNPTGSDQSRIVADLALVHQ